MTLADHRLLPLPLPPCINQRIDVQWSATTSAFNGRRHQFVRSSLVISLQMTSVQRGIIESWLESPDGRRCILPRASMAIETSVSNGYWHVDVQSSSPESEQNVASFTFRVDPASADFVELVFARTSLLRQAGFSGGIFDPPILINQNVAHAAIPA